MEIIIFKEGYKIKKVTGYISVRALGTHYFEFYVEDNATDAEIAKLANKKCDYYIDYSVEEDYEPVAKQVYIKKY